MNELLEKDQVISIVPKDFRNSNKGKVVDIQERGFSIEVIHAPTGILANTLIEFYSPTKNGMLYFSTSISDINENILTVKAPIKHRFLQRRAFTRVKFEQEMNFEANDKSYKINSIDLSAGGIKLKSDEFLDINTDYGVCVKLMINKTIECTFEPIRIEKNEEETYTLSGRFKNLTNTDKMMLIQFCMRKNIENMNK